jgi:hypothetical protein
VSLRMRLLLLVLLLLVLGRRRWLICSAMRRLLGSWWVPVRGQMGLAPRVGEHDCSGAVADGLRWCY